MIKVLPIREREQFMEDNIKDRLKTILPIVMKETGFDMWIVMTDEQNEDPVTKTLIPPCLQNARGKMILVFSLLPDGTVEAQTVSRPSGIEHIYLNKFYGITSTDWKGKQITPPSMSALEYVKSIVEAYNPKKIGINTDCSHPYCDGLTLSNYNALKNALGEYAERLISATELGVRWMETRSKAEIAVYNDVVGIAHGIIAECFNPDVIIPGKSTVDDARYFMSQRMSDLGVMPSFEASCAVFRHGEPGMHNEGITIMPGDILHCDMGIDYLGLCTDTQKLAYILRPGETEAPEGLKNALKTANRLQDIVCSLIKVGKTGNDVLEQARKQAIDEGITPCIYTHPLGVFAHAPGPSIGRFGNQKADVHGEPEFHPSTVYSLELNATVKIPEWNGESLMTCIETDIYFDGDTVHYIADRQTELILI